MTVLPSDMTFPFGKSPFQRQIGYWRQEELGFAMLPSGFEDGCGLFIRCSWALFTSEAICWSLQTSSTASVYFLLALDLRRRRSPELAFDDPKPIFVHLPTFRVKRLKINLTGTVVVTKVK